MADDPISGHVSVNLQADHINEYVVKAILDAKLGKIIQAAIQKETDKIKDSYSRVLEDAIKRAVQEEVTQFIKLELSEVVKEKCREKLTDDVVVTLVNRAWEKCNERW